MTIRPEDESRIIRYSWEEMDTIHRSLADQVRASDFAPDVIIGIMRCGQVTAVHLAYLLGIRKVASIGVKTMPIDRPLANERIPAEVTTFVPSGYLRGQRVLLVDAVMESGTTVEICLEELARLGAGQVAVAIAVDWYNSDYKIASGKRPHIDFVGGSATMWPDFPWEG